MNTRLTSLFVILLSFYLMSCGDESGSASVQVVMVDAPAAYEAVNISIEDVKYKVGSDTSDGGTWTSLEGFTPATYDLLTLTNGEEAFLGELEMGQGTLGQIRLILGSENSLTIDGQEHELKVPSGSKSGLKLNIHEEVLEGVSYKLVLDFDAAKSIVASGNSGNYNLKPVIRASMEAQSGAISGIYSPAEVSSVIYAIIDTDSISTYPDEDGSFLIRALEPGNYAVAVVPDEASGYTAETVSNVEVTAGSVTEMDTVKITN